MLCDCIINLSIKQFSRFSVKWIVYVFQARQWCVKNLWRQHLRRHNNAMSWRRDKGVLYCVPSKGNINTCHWLPWDELFWIVSYPGGIFVDSTVHDLDICSWLAGSKPTTVFAHGSTFIHRWTSVVHLTLSNVTGKLVGVTFDWRHVMTTAVQRNGLTHRLVPLPCRVLSKLNT